MRFLAAGALVFLFSCFADLFVLRTTWTGRQISEGQVRRGYFERFDDGINLAVDNAIRPVFPSCVLTDDDALAVPPGMSAVVPLEAGTVYEVASLSELAPYVLLAAEAPVEPIFLADARPGEARLTGSRTLVVRDGSLQLTAWNPARPWREDAASLAALREACREEDEFPFHLTVSVDADEVHLQLGGCSLTEPLATRQPGSFHLAALSGPDWLTLARRPGWAGERWLVWPIVGIVVAKVALSIWSIGLVSTAALSGILAALSLLAPVPATLTWPLTLIAVVAVALLRGAWFVLRNLPSRWRLPAVVIVPILIGAGVMLMPREPRQFPPIVRTDEDQTPPDACAIVGYSTAGGASLRGGYGGVTAYLNEKCAACRNKTGNLTAGGQTLEWARDAYCASEASFGADGHVLFFGGANDDFFWGLLTVARMFVVGEQSVEQWYESQAPAAAASLARADDQVAALQGLMQCARSRGAEFVFLHDFLVTDIVQGRDPDRTAMLERRRAAAEREGGRFVDLLDVFADEAGVTWFNDYVHPAAIAHERIAGLACRLVESRL